MPTQIGILLNPTPKWNKSFILLKHSVSKVLNANKLLANPKRGVQSKKGGIKVFIDI